MNEQENINYMRITEAIAYIKNNFKQQPSLEEVAEKVNLSSYPLITIILTLINLLVVYYFTIYKTELFLKFLRIDIFFGTTRIEKLDVSLEKYAQLSILVVSIFLLIIYIPNLVYSFIRFINVKEELRGDISSEFYSSSLITLMAILLLLFNDKLSKVIMKC